MYKNAYFHMDFTLGMHTEKKAKNADKNRKKNQSSLAATTRDNKVRLTLGFED